MSELRRLFGFRSDNVRFQNIQNSKYNLGDPLGDFLLKKRAAALSAPIHAARSYKRDSFSIKADHISDPHEFPLQSLSRGIRKYPQIKEENNSPKRIHSTI
ncbi:hypothetical protein DLM75_17175 [Leptospira stimsonii]|uniref:Uncharacterized protein n=1 Tax=Leptospira stimsonii TaxID=2202203 RepID=A0A396Z149_9LEPT|nr:hypothetical protein DLM75_17175 [Leptospira stimsonii]